MVAVARRPRTRRHAVITNPRAVACCRTDVLRAHRMATLGVARALGRNGDRHRLHPDEDRLPQGGHRVREDLAGCVAPRRSCSSRSTSSPAPSAGACCSRPTARESRPSLLRATRLYFISFFYNNYLPGAVAGDVVRGVVDARRVRRARRDRRARGRARRARARPVRRVPAARDRARARRAARSTPARCGYGAGSVSRARSRSCSRCRSRGGSHRCCPASCARSPSACRR